MEYFFLYYYHKFIYILGNNQKFKFKISYIILNFKVKNQLILLEYIYFPYMIYKTKYFIKIH